jgi:hypothetical protein
MTSNKHTAGYIAALGDLCRSGHKDIAENMLDESGLNLNDILKSGADGYDIAEIKQLEWSLHKCATMMT